MKPRPIPIIAFALALAGAALAAGTPPDSALGLLDPRSAGEATVDLQTRAAFTQHVPGLDAEDLAAFAFGNRIFSTSWVEAPASVALFDGLGPYFSSRSCSGCHLRDGRGRPPRGPVDSSEPTMVRLGVVHAGAPRGPDPRYGSQLSNRAIQGLAPEGRLVVTWIEREHEYPDGSRVVLRRPRLEIAGLAQGPLDDGTRVSLRMAPAIPGVGLLEAIPDSVIASLADPEDADRDGVSGRVHWLKGAAGAAGRTGRFGWKATQATIADQVTTALSGDMGLTTPQRPQVELAAAQSHARARASGGEPEVESTVLDALLRYCHLLAVPARRNLEDPAVQRGARHFRELRCTGCHVPSLTTGSSPLPSLSRQTVHPYSDLLLHDMGPELSDDLPEGSAQATEWRTPPLWGLGLGELVSGHRYLLHDGRARGVEEAILWHGGEAHASREAFRALPSASRRELLEFLESL